MNVHLFILGKSVYTNKQKEKKVTNPILITAINVDV